MFKLFSFEGWNKPTNDEELFQRIEKADPNWAKAIKFHRKFGIKKWGIGIGIFLGVNFGILFTTKNEWLDNLIPSLDENDILRVIIFGLIFALILALTLKKLSDFLWFKKLQKLESRGTGK